MEPTTILYILLGIVTFDFVLERVLHLLNRQRAHDPIPKELEGIYDEQGYAKSQAYTRDTTATAPKYPSSMGWRMSWPMMPPVSNISPMPNFSTTSIPHTHRNFLGSFASRDPK